MANRSAGEIAIVNALRRLKPGEVVAYGELARRAGLPGRARWVACGFAPTLRRYAFSLHPTDSSQCAVVARVEAQRAETRGTA